jgi:putative DNA primase/helicase
MESDDKREWEIARAAEQVEETIRSIVPDGIDHVAPSPEMQAVAALLKLDPISRAKAKKTIAKKFGVPQAAIDEALASLQPVTRSDQVSLAPPAPAPASEPVVAASLLDDLRAFLKRFVILDELEVIAVSLWIAFAYFFEIAETSPRLRIKSPEKRCGKSRLLEVLELLIPRSIAASNMGASAIFRTIEAEHCTVLIDEADTFVRGNLELRGLLNSGHRRPLAYVIRAIPAGDRDWVTKKFSTWCPMAIAGIGKLADTLEDRSISITMRRKLRTEKVERLTRRNTSAREKAKTLAAMLARFAHDNLDKVRDVNLQILDGLNDRAMDNWEHLLAIAEVAGGNWPEYARAAAWALSGDREDSDSLRTRLLADIRDITQNWTEDVIRSKELCEALAGIETAPWSEIGRGKPITQRRLAGMLKDFGIYPRDIPGRHVNGYVIRDFEDAFSRYLSIPPLQSSIVRVDIRREGESALFDVRTPRTSEIAETPTESKPTRTIELQKGG